MSQKLKLGNKGKVAFLNKITSFHSSFNPLYFQSSCTSRPSHIHGTKKNEPKPVGPQPQALAVAPLNSMPYVGPDISYSLPTEAEYEATKRVRTDMIFTPFGPTKEEGVGLTGSAAMVKVGSSFGLVDIGEFEDSYLFRVTLPGVARDESKLLNCD